MQKVEMVESRRTSGNSEVLLSSEMLDAFAFSLNLLVVRNRPLYFRSFFLPKKVTGFIIWVAGGAKGEEIYEKL